MLNPFSLNIYSHVKKLGHPMPVFFFFFFDIFGHMDIYYQF